jgi:hypothetical protein
VTWRCVGRQATLLWLASLSARRYERMANAHQHVRTLSSCQRDRLLQSGHPVHDQIDAGIFLRNERSRESRRRTQFRGRIQPAKASGPITSWSPPHVERSKAAHSSRFNRGVPTKSQLRCTHRLHVHRHISETGTVRPGIRRRHERVPVAAHVCWT